MEALPAVPLRDTFKISPTKHPRVLLFNVNETLVRFKPNRIVCKWASGEMGVVPADCILFAAHGWGFAGAQWSGLRSACIAREGRQRLPLAEPPEIDALDVASIGADVWRVSCLTTSRPGARGQRPALP